ncbi:MAG TPA: TrmH family RNA methyltransferase [Terriglobales bacterium]
MPQPAITDRIRVVLVHARNPLNMGAAARAMANFGLSDLVLVAPYDTAWQTARSARAGAAVLANARAVATLEEAIAGCGCVIGTTAGTARVPEIPLEAWSTVAASLPALPPGVPVALLFGSEKTGLGIEEISYCDRLARIPTLPDAPSMNLGQAVAVCAYELARQAAPAIADTPPAVPGAAGAAVITLAQRERLVATWRPLMEQLGVTEPLQRERQTRVLREMLIRWRLTPKDAHRLLGLARQVRHALTGKR